MPLVLRVFNNIHSKQFLQIHRVLVAERYLRHADVHWPYHRRIWLVLQHHHDNGSDKQLHQPFHLRRQVPRVPDGRQTHAAQTGRAVSSPC